MSGRRLPKLAVGGRREDDEGRGGGGVGGGGGGGSGFHTERHVVRRNGRAKEWWNSAEHRSDVPLTSRSVSVGEPLFPSSFQDQIRRRYQLSHEAVPRCGHNTAFKTSEDLEKAIKPTSEQPSHFGGDRDRYITSYGYDSRYINAQAQGGDVYEDSTKDNSIFLSRQQIRQDRVRRNQERVLKLDDLAPPQEYEMREALDNARKEQKLLKIIANRDFFESSSQDLHVYNQDPKRRGTYEKFKFHISPHIEQQRLARRQHESVEREKKIRMSEEKKMEEEYFRKDIHQKRVERYHEFANNLEERRNADAFKRIEDVNKQNLRYADFAERVSPLGDDGLSLFLTLVQLRCKEEEDDYVNFEYRLANCL
eukprot:747824-Hanusia_phi.AAC.7